MQASSNHCSIPVAPCFCLCHHSLPCSNKSPAFALDFLPGLIKDASYLTHGGIIVKVEGRDSFVSSRCLTAEPPTYHILQADTGCPNEPDPNSFLAVTLPEDCFHLLWDCFTHGYIHCWFLLFQWKLLSRQGLTTWKLLNFIPGESCMNWSVFSTCATTLKCAEMKLFWEYTDAA